MCSPFYRETFVEINLDAIQHNVYQFLRIIPEEMKLLVAVKADAYGHGTLPVARAAIHAGAKYLGVAFVDEGIQLRAGGLVEPILVFGYTPPHAVEQAVLHDLTFTVYDEKHLDIISQKAAELGKKAKVHVKVDTGMGRIGIEPAQTLSFVHKIIELPYLEIEGIYTHFATADDDVSYLNKQSTQFEAVLQNLADDGISIPLRHAANSAGILRMEETKCNMARLGISLYGFQDVPYPDVKLKPALSLRSKVVHVKQPLAGSGISYGKTYVTTGHEWIATIPIGYADGIDRGLSNKGFALVNGVRVPIVGRVCMDQLMLDVSKAMPVSVGDEVTFIGQQGNQQITAAELADLIGTIHYEIVTRLGSRLPRLYYQDGNLIEIDNRLL